MMVYLLKTLTFDDKPVIVGNYYNYTFDNYSFNTLDEQFLNYNYNHIF